MGIADWLNRLANRLRRKPAAMPDHPTVRQPSQSAKVLGEEEREELRRQKREEAGREIERLSNPALYPHSAEFYFGEIMHYLNWLAEGDALGRRWQRADDQAEVKREMDRHKERFRRDDIYQRRVQALWALRTKGMEAMPYALQLLKHREAEARSDGACILEALGHQPGVVESLLEVLESEPAEPLDENKDVEALDSIVIALGGLKAKEAVPALAKLMRDTERNEDSRLMAVESLGKIVRRRFDKQPDPIQAAEDWLTQHGY